MNLQSPLECQNFARGALRSYNNHFVLRAITIAALYSILLTHAVQYIPKAGSSECKHPTSEASKLR
jgi:hypothetical protein